MRKMSFDDCQMEPKKKKHGEQKLFIVHCFFFKEKKCRKTITGNNSNLVIKKRHIVPVVLMLE